MQLTSRTSAARSAHRGRTRPSRSSLCVEVAPPQHDGDGRPHRQQREPAVRVGVDLRHGADAAGVARDHPQQPERPVHGLGTEAGAAVEIGLGEAGDVRQVAAVGLADRREDAAVGRDVVEARPQVGDRQDRRGAILAHPHHDTVRELAPDARRADPEPGAQTRLRSRGIDVPDAVAGADAERVPQLGLREPAVVMDHDLADREVRMVLDGLQHGPRGEGQRRQYQQRRHRPPRDARQGPLASLTVPATNGATYQLPTSRTSGSSHTPLRSHTARWAVAISACTSAASARPSFTMKFA